MGRNRNVYPNLFKTSFITLSFLIAISAFNLDIAFGQDTDLDGIPDITDNCPGSYNPFQDDSFPPSKNNIGDACECEGNFSCSTDQDVDGLTLSPLNKISVEALF